MGIRDIDLFFCYMKLRDILGHIIVLYNVNKWLCEHGDSSKIVK